MLRGLRNPTMFERLLLVIGGFVMVAGYLMIHSLALKGGLDSALLQVVFTWLMLVMIIILVAVSEDMKEELRLINSNQLVEVRLLNEETQLLKQETRYVKEEISLLRNEMTKKPVKKVKKK